MNPLILVVDDNPRNIRLLTEILEDRNFRVIQLDSGTRVLETARAEKPDLILLDIMMPEMDGMEVCRRMKADEELRDIPIIMVTAKTQGSDVSAALELGAVDYVKKPIDEDEVLARINAALRQSRQHSFLRESAMKDGLTGLYNRNMIFDQLSREYAKLDRQESSLTFVMADIDHFKRINDTWGHAAGDDVLRQTAEILKNSIREGDILGRYGGEEFALVLLDISTEDAAALCTRIRKAVEELRFEINGESIRVTISLGLCSRTADAALGQEELVRRADKALYKAKALGRNRVEICES